MKLCLGGNELHSTRAALIYKTMIHGNVDHLDRVYDVCDIVGIQLLLLAGTGSDLAPRRLLIAAATTSR